VKVSVFRSRTCAVKLKEEHQEGPRSWCGQGMARSEKYETKGQIDELGGLSDRLALDLRKVRWSCLGTEKTTHQKLITRNFLQSIQSLSMQPLLTPQWCEIAETFSRIGKVSVTVPSDPVGTKPSSAVWTQMIELAHR
jgi:hypothetical protein